MGTSSAFPGQGGGTPLVPSWLGNGGAPPAAPAPAPPVPDPNGTPDSSPRNPAPGPDGPSALPPLPPVGASDRFAASRNNFSRYASSGGRDSRNLGKAISGYVRSSSGGASTAASRMGSSRGASNRLLSVLSSVVAHGASEGLRRLNLGELAGLPIDKVFVGLVDYVCPDGGSIDEGIAREAFIETISDLADEGITDLDSMNEDQMHTVFELYATRAIEARICNDIGANAITFPADPREAAQLQVQLRDFIRRGVADAVTASRSANPSLATDEVQSFVDHVYREAYDILQIMGEAEAVKR